MLILISGKPNSGKTHCMNHLKHKYQNVLIIDEYVLSIYQHGQIGYNAIKGSFGSNFVDEKAVIKNKLRDLILSDHAMNERLQNLIWPMIRNKINDIKQNGTNYIIEMAIYDIDIKKYFTNLFDITINIKSDAHILNNKSQFNDLYLDSNQVYDYTVINHNNEQYIQEIEDIINHYFV